MNSADIIVPTENPKVKNFFDKFSDATRLYICSYDSSERLINDFTGNEEEKSIIRRYVSDEMLHDSNVQREHNQQYEGKVQDAAQAVNNAYLKTFDEAGVKSYGLVVDYLIAEYLRNPG